MGMTIEEIERRLTDFLDYIPYDIEDGKKDCEAIEEALSMIKAYKMIKSDYEGRLKTDLKAILVELELEIEECVDGAEGSPQFEQGVTNARVQVVKMIQEKINALKTEGEKIKDGNYN